MSLSSITGGEAKTLSWSARNTINELKEKESRALGKMLLENIRDGLRNEDIHLSHEHLELLSNVYHDAMNRFFERKYFLLSIVGRSPDTSLWKEGIIISTWLNTVGFLPAK